MGSSGSSIGAGADAAMDVVHVAVRYLEDAARSGFLAIGCCHLLHLLLSLVQIFYSLTMGSRTGFCWRPASLEVELGSVILEVVSCCDRCRVINGRGFHPLLLVPNHRDLLDWTIRSWVRFTTRRPIQVLEASPYCPVLVGFARCRWKEGLPGEMGSWIWVQWWLHEEEGAPYDGALAVHYNMVYL
ncbi:hypothetical protein ACLOJK_039176 [Asimina triloba]